MKKNLRRALAATTLAASSAAGFSVPAALASPTGPGQFVAYAESRTVLVTPVHLSTGEVIHLGLGGQAFTVVTESFNGGGTVFTVAPVLPAGDVHRTLLFTS